MRAFIRNWSLSTKMFSYAGLMLAILIMSFGYAIYSLYQIGNELTSIVEDDMPLTKHLSQVTVIQLGQAISFERILFHGEAISNAESEAQLETAISHFQASIVKFTAGTDKINSLFKQVNKDIQHGLQSPDPLIASEMKHIDKAVTHIIAAHDSYVEHAIEVFILFAQGFTHQAEQAAIQVEHEEEALDHETEALQLEIIEFTEKGVMAAQQHEQQLIWILLIVGVASLFIGAIISVLLSRYLIGGIRTAIKVASGDLSNTITVNSKDEIGQLLQSMNTMKTRLVTMIRDIAVITEQLTSSSQEMTAATTRSSEIVSKQTTETELVASSMDELTQTAQGVSNHINDTASSAVKATETTSKGRVVIQKAVTEIEILSEQINNAAETITQLDAQSTNINSVMTVIESIAEQTNLLALNAAIEAARAGEQGRGFAVVADEVRTLAVRTQASTKEIHEIISSFQDGTGRASELMRKSLEQTNSVVTRTRDSDTAFGTISDEVEKISHICNQMSAASVQQESIGKEVNLNIVHFNEMATETSHNTKKSSQSSLKLEHITAELHQIVGHYSV